MKNICCVFILMICCASPAFAATKFTKKCPYSCKTLGIDKKFCKDYKEGNKCAVEVLPGATADGKTVFKKKCPLTCQSMGIEKSHCKDWKEKDGKQCVVQI